MSAVTDQDEPKQKEIGGRVVGVDEVVAGLVQPALAVVADVTLPEDVERLFAAAVEQLLPR